MDLKKTFAHDGVTHTKMLKFSKRRLMLAWYIEIITWLPRFRLTYKHVIMNKCYVHASPEIHLIYNLDSNKTKETVFLYGDFVVAVLTDLNPSVTSTTNKFFA